MFGFTMALGKPKEAAMSREPVNWNWEDNLYNPELYT
jgi:hypothetical protein